MKRTITTLIALIAAAGLTSVAVAQGRHDEKPHGYNDKVAAEQRANTAQAQPRTLAVGPRAHDNPLRFVKIKPAAVPNNDPATVTKAKQ